MRRLVLSLLAMIACGGSRFCSASEFTTASPLVAAAAFGRLADVKALLESGANPSPPKINGDFTPYEAALWNDQPETAEYLAAHGADTLNALRPPPGRIYGRVLDENNMPLVDVLVKIFPTDTYAGPNPYPSMAQTDAEGRFKFINLKPGTYLARLEGQTQEIEVVLTEEIPIVEKLEFRTTRLEKQSQDLLDAIHYGRPETVQHLLKAGADANTRDESSTTALMLAARAGYLEAVKQLVEAGAELDAKDNKEKSAIDYATLESHEEIIEYLLNMGSPTSMESLPPRGVIQGIVLDEEGRPLTGIQVEICSTDSNSFSSMRTETGMDGAFLFQHLEPQTVFVGLVDAPITKIQVTLEHRTSVVENVELHTTKQVALNQRLMSAAYNPDPTESLNLLLEGAEVNARTGTGETPLMRAARGRRAEVIHALLVAGADVNAKDNTGESVLIQAVQVFNFDNVVVSPDYLKPLIEAGANLQESDSAGRTPLWYAIERDQDAIANFLREQGAEEPQANLPDRGIIGGIVRDQDENPLPHATVQCARIGEIGKPKFSGFSFDSTSTDKNGLFEFRHLASGVYEVRSGNSQSPPQKVEIESHRSKITNLVFHSSSKIETEQEMISAASSGDEQTVIACLAAGADVNAVDRHSQMTALQNAASGQHPQMVAILLKAGANTDPPTERRMPALVLAALNGNLEIVKLLVEAGANLEAKDFQETTPMEAAEFWEENDDVIAYLLEKGALPSTQPKGIIRGIVRDAQGKPLPNIPVKMNQYVEEKNITFSYNQSTQKDGRFEWKNLTSGTYQIYLRGADTKGIETKLKDNRDIVEHIELQTSLQAELNADFMDATSSGNADEIRRLYKQGASVNALHQSGITPLIQAAVDWNSEIIRLLLELGADPNLQGQQGESALTKATRSTSQWRKAKADESPNHMDEKGIAWVVQNECDECVHLLLEAGADTESCDSQEQTPLIACARGNRLASFRLLLEAGAVVNALDKYGHSALWYAMKYDQPEMVTLLRNRGAVELEPAPRSIIKKK